MKGLMVKIGANIAEFSKGLRGMEKEAGSTSKLIKSHFGKMLGGTALLVGFAKITDDLDRVGKLAQRLGTSAESIQRLSHAAKLNGADIEQVADMLKDANIKAEEAQAGIKSAADGFKAMGISVTEFKGMNPEEQVGALADGFNRANAAGQGFATAQQIIGGSAMELRPLLKKGSEGIREQGQSASVASTKTVEGVQKMNDQFTIASNKALGFGITVIETLAKTWPILVRTKDAIRDSISLAINLAILQVETLHKAFKALLSLDGSGALDAIADGGAATMRLADKRAKQFRDNNIKMFDALGTAELKAKMAVRDAVEKRDKESEKRQEASALRVQAMKEAEAAKIKVPERFKITDIKGLKPLSSLASVGGGGNASFSFQSLTKAAMKTNELLQQVANNTSKPSVAILA